MFLTLLVAALTAVTLALAPASTAQPPVKPAKVQKAKQKAKVRYGWVCSGNSYMMFKKGFNPQTHGCHRSKPTKVAD